MVFNDSYLGNANREALLSNRISPDLAPSTNNDHKWIVYEHFQSQIIAHAVFGHFDQASITKLMTMKRHFTWLDSNSDSYYDGTMMAHLIVLERNPETKVGVQDLRSKISSTKSSMFRNNVPDMLEHMVSVIDTIFLDEKK